MGVLTRKVFEFEVSKSAQFFETIRGGEVDGADHTDHAPAEKRQLQFPEGVTVDDLTSFLLEDGDVQAAVKESIEMQERIESKQK